VPRRASERRRRKALTCCCCPRRRVIAKTAELPLAHCERGRGLEPWPLGGPLILVLVLLLLVPLLLFLHRRNPVLLIVVVQRSPVLPQGVVHLQDVVHDALGGGQVAGDARRHLVLGRVVGAHGQQLPARVALEVRPLLDHLEGLALVLADLVDGGGDPSPRPLAQVAGDALVRPPCAPPKQSNKINSPAHVPQDHSPQ